MTWEWLGLGGLALVALGLLVALARLRGRTTRDLAAARAESAELRDRLDRLERERSRPVADDREYRITGVGGFETGLRPSSTTGDPGLRPSSTTGDPGLRPSSTTGDPGLPPSSTAGDDGEHAHLERAVFADLVLRESVIRVGSLAHGVRRALAPEARNRIRFEMRRELRRARKQRRADRRTAHREWQARQREALTDDDLRDTA